MAKEFCQRGIASVAVYSGENGEYAEERNEAIRKLKNGEIRVIFSVDMFNEGVDIASLDMVMFLRPTESPDDCIVDFDMRLIDLFKEMDRKKLTLKMQIR